MSKSITKKNKTDLTTEFTKYGYEVAPGDLFFDEGYDLRVIKVTKIEDVAKVNWDKWNKAGRPEDRSPFEVPVPYVFYRYAKNESFTEWRDYEEKQELGDFLKKHIERKIVDIHTHMKEACSILNKEKSLDDYKPDSDSIDEDKALIHTGSKKHLVSLRHSLAARKEHVELIRCAMKIEMQRRREELEQLKDGLETHLALFQAKIEQVSKIIATIELYLGIKEDIIQIQDGTAAPADTPIALRQQVLCMDEEVGDPTDGGLDFQNIADFDAWLLKYSDFHKQYNYDIVLPEKKGLVAFRVRRREKEYASNPWVNSLLNQENWKTYLFIRNGDNLYRIWGDLYIWPRLFPLRNELAELYEKWDDLKEGLVTRARARETDSASNRLFSYKRNLIMIQGLIDRTEVFYPLKQKINLLKIGSEESGAIRLIHDDEASLPDSRPPFFERLKEINRAIGKNSRIIWISDYKLFPIDFDDRLERLDERFYNKYSCPPPPATGVYKVYTAKRPGRKWSADHKEIKRRLVIRYNPKDEVCNLWDPWSEPHERINRLSWLIEHDDKQIINYDALSPEEIDYYLHSRVNRRISLGANSGYLHMMPLLMELKTRMLKEREYETGLVEALCTANDLKESDVREAIDWWKKRNGYVRALRNDDALAWRMIKRRLKI